MPKLTQRRKRKKERKTLGRTTSQSWVAVCYTCTYLWASLQLEITVRFSFRLAASLRRSRLHKMGWFELGGRRARNWPRPTTITRLSFKRVHLRIKIGFLVLGRLFYIEKNIKPDPKKWADFELGVIQKPFGQVQVGRWSKIWHFFSLLTLTS